ncbi:MAG TPA: MliC family protein [Longimicrobiaceae bacterium]|jgi:membrane-bound inhibitor of C-type lysozyme|nr:MliC family protein [Longimicrobiaceae bacterium]
MNRQWIAAALLAVTAAGCARPRGYEFRCPDGTSVRARFVAGGDSVVLSSGASSVHLPRTLSADGGRYANDTLVFWEKGRTASIARAGHPAVEGCTRGDGE